MKPSQLVSLGRKAVNAWIDDFAPSMGASISYYTVFSLAPLLVIVIAIAGAISLGARPCRARSSRSCRA